MAKTPMLTGPEIETGRAPLGAGQWWAVRGVEAAMLAVAAVFVALHFVHLKADFPNYFFWRDWAKYTDEGWYGDAAIRLYQLGHWNLPGDFNPGAALPVWPAIEIVLFRATGVSLVAARALTVAVFALLLVCCFAPGFFFVRRLRWNPLEKLCGSIGLSLILIYLASWGIYCVGARDYGMRVHPLPFVVVSLVCAAMAAVCWKDIVRLLRAACAGRTGSPRTDAMFPEPLVSDGKSASVLEMQIG